MEQLWQVLYHHAVRHQLDGYLDEGYEDSQEMAHQAEEQLDYHLGTQTAEQFDRYRKEVRLLWIQEREAAFRAGLAMGLSLGGLGQGA